MVKLSLMSLAVAATALLATTSVSAHKTKCGSVATKSFTSAPPTPVTPPPKYDVPKIPAPLPPTTEKKQETPKETPQEAPKEAPKAPPPAPTTKITPPETKKPVPTAAPIPPKAPAPSPSGGNDIRSVTLDLHNKARAVIGASPLTWDDRLEKFAKQWAQKLVSDTPGKLSLVHSQSTGDGENLYGSFGTAGADTSAAKGVQAWINEGPPKGQGGFNHYSQLMGRNVKALGCADATSADKTFYYLVCEYNPNGNTFGADGKLIGARGLHRRTFVSRAVIA
ncbi:CAP domain-containing protein [Phlyctochytrium arcticum]|nr:CAP domain-containing protein [Phlyctochytrium arcticum]